VERAIAKAGHSRTYIGDEVEGQPLSRARADVPVETVAPQTPCRILGSRILAWNFAPQLSVFDGHRRLVRPSRQRALVRHRWRDGISG
jgi:hypothetical protein